MTGRREHGVDRVAVEPSGVDLGPQLARGVLGRAGVAVGTGLGHRVVGVGRGQQARRRRQHRAADPAVVAGAVHPLVVRRREQADPAQRFGPLEDPLHVVHVQAHALPVGRAERTRLAPHGAGHAEAPEVVHQRGAAHEPGLVGREREQLGRGRATRSAVPRQWPAKYAAAQVAEVADRLEVAVELVVGHRGAAAPARRRGTRRRPPRRCRRTGRRDRCTPRRRWRDRSACRCAPAPCRRHGRARRGAAPPRTPRPRATPAPRATAHRPRGRRGRPCRPSARTPARARRAPRRRGRDDRRTPPRPSSGWPSAPPPPSRRVAIRRVACATRWAGEPPAPARRSMNIVAWRPARSICTTFERKSMSSPNSAAASSP